MKTKERIIQAALNLFNEQGERNVTTNHIAAHINISPGNLYYHFANKQAIIHAIFTYYAQELLASFSPQPEQRHGQQLFQHYLNALFQLMWKYRFFYANLPEILRQDPQLHADYVQLQEKLQRNLTHIMTVFIDLGWLKLEASAQHSLMTTVHLMATSWLSYQSAMSLDTPITDRTICQGISHIIAVLNAHATLQGQQQLAQVEAYLLSELTV